MNKESGKRSREIGGYLELERFSGPMMHEDAMALSSGRACLSYLIEQRDIRKLLLPDLLCDAVTKVCEERGVAVRRFIFLSFFPVNLPGCLALQRFFQVL